MSDGKRLVEILHTMSCNKEHATEMQELLTARAAAKCYFYLERCIASDESLPDHKTWEEEALRLCNSLNASPTEVIRMLTTCLDIRRRLEEFLSKHPTGQVLARQFLLDVLD